MQVAAIDQGTTATKGMLVAEDGSLTLLGSVRHRQILPRTGWVEQDASELLGNVRQLIEAGIGRGAEAVALANQGETVVAWNRSTGVPICNAIVWQDQRTARIVERLESEGVADEVLALSGLPLDAYFSASKLHWILAHVAEAGELMKRGVLGLGTSDSYFLHQLTGRYATDVTTAARTSLMNLRTFDWDPRLCEIFGVPLDALPEISECEESFGQLTGSNGAVEIRAAMVDQVAALYGHGCRCPGDIKATFGTGAFALMITEGRPEIAGVGTTVGWGGPGQRVFAADGAVYTAGAAVEWLGRLGLVTGISDLQQLGGASAVSKGLCFVPALSGLACPHWDRSAAGLWIGLDNATDRTDLIKAVLEGVAFRMSEVLDALGSRDECRGMLSVDGGLTRSQYFLDFFAAVARRPVVSHAQAELTAYGAALLAGSGAASTGLGGHVVNPPASSERQVPAWRDLFAEARRRSSAWRSTTEGYAFDA